MREQAKEMSDRVTASGGYNEALAIIAEYVNPVSNEDMDEDYDEDIGMCL
jgi:hypothetical protein